MALSMTRRNLVRAGMALPALIGSRAAAHNRADITVGITVDTRPDWNGAANFIRSIDEASQVGYHWIETFWPYVARWENNPQGLKDELDKRNLKLETVSNGAGMRTNFTDAGERSGVIEDHMKLVQFIHWFGCDHLKINIGGQQGIDPRDRLPIYKEMATTFNEIGRRMWDLGMKFGIHAHLNSAFEVRQDMDAIMDLTNPKWVYLIIDTGHTSMAGMDPVKLTDVYSSRIVEYHMKDVAPEHRGGYMGPPRPRMERGQGQGRGPNPGGAQPAAQAGVNPYIGRRQFFELGYGGVDFPSILAILNDRGWKGWMTVELDSTETTAKESCAVSKKYLEKVLRLKV